MFEAKVIRPVKAGQVLSLVNHRDGSLGVRPYVMGKKCPIGVAKRNMKKGEMVKYDPNGNTEDVLVKAIFVLRNPLGGLSL